MLALGDMKLRGGELRLTEIGSSPHLMMLVNEQRLARIL